MPSKYLPEKEVFFEATDCNQYNKLIQFIQNSMQKSDNEFAEIFEIKKEDYFWQKYFEPFKYSRNNILSGNYNHFIKKTKHYTSVKFTKEYENKNKNNLTKNLNYVSANY